MGLQSRTPTLFIIMAWVGGHRAIFGKKFTLHPSSGQPDAKMVFSCTNKACYPPPPLQSPPPHRVGPPLWQKGIGNTRRRRKIFFGSCWSCCSFSATIVWCNPPRGGTALHDRPPPMGGTSLTLGGGGYKVGGRYKKTNAHRRRAPQTP